MKKVLSLLLGATLLFTGAFNALAWEGEAKTLTSSTGLYTIDIPKDYLPITKETMNELIAEIGESVLKEAGLDTSLLEAMTDPSNKADYVFAPDLSGNLNVQVTVQSGITSELFPLVASQLGSAISAQYEQVGVGKESQEDRGLVEVGDVTFYNYFVNITGADMDQFITCDAEGNMFTMTFTNFDDELKQMILESFTPVQE